MKESRVINITRLLLQFRDYFGRAVGSCSESVRIKDGLDVSVRVLRMRYAGHKSVSPHAHRALMFTSQLV